MVPRSPADSRRRRGRLRFRPSERVSLHVVSAHIRHRRVRRTSPAWTAWSRSRSPAAVPSCSRSSCWRCSSSPGGVLRGGAASRPPPAGRLERIPAPAPVSRVVVHVVGAVRRPGLYRLRDGSRVADALARAGGAGRADLAAVNLAAPLADGSQVLVRAAPRRAHPRMDGSRRDAQVSLASATLEQLDALPGVGPVTAQRILDHRERRGRSARWTTSTPCRDRTRAGRAAPGAGHAVKGSARLSLSPTLPVAAPASDSRSRTGCGSVIVALDARWCSRPESPWLCEGSAALAALGRVCAGRRPLVGARLRVDASIGAFLHGASEKAEASSPSPGQRDGRRSTSVCRPVRRLEGVPIPRAHAARAAARPLAAPGRAHRPASARPGAAAAENGFDGARMARQARRTRGAPRREHWRVVGRRGGFAGGRPPAPTSRAVDRARPAGERRAVVAGIVLGEDEGCRRTWDEFRASGLYHLLAVSGQTCSSSPRPHGLAWLLGFRGSRSSSSSSPRSAPTSTLSAGNRRSSVPASPGAGVARVARSKAARPLARARLGAFVLLGGCLRRCSSLDSSSPLPPSRRSSSRCRGSSRGSRAVQCRPARDVLAVTIACGVATADRLAPVRAVPLYRCRLERPRGPGRCAAPDPGPRRGGVEPVVPSAALAIAWLNGWLAAYLAWWHAVVGCHSRS